MDRMSAMDTGSYFKSTPKSLNGPISVGVFSCLDRTTSGIRAGFDELVTATATA